MKKVCQIMKVATVGINFCYNRYLEKIGFWSSKTISERTSVYFKFKFSVSLWVYCISHLSIPCTFELIRYGILSNALSWNLLYHQDVEISMTYVIEGDWKLYKNVLK